MNERPKLSDKAIALLQQGKKIGAIKQVREDHGLGLREAKDLVDSYVAQNLELPTSLRESSNHPRVTIYLLVAIAVLITYQFSQSW